MKLHDAVLIKEVRYWDNQNSKWEYVAKGTKVLVNVTRGWLRVKTKSFTEINKDEYALFN